MKIFVTGASGYVGRHIATELLARGYRVTGMARRPSARTEYLPEMEWCFAELADVDRYQERLQSHDSVIHCAMDYSETGSENANLDRGFLENIAGFGGRFIYTGNLFSPRRGGKKFLDEAPVADSGNWRFEHESFVLNTVPRSSIIRLGFVYGGDGGHLWEILSPGTVFSLSPEEIPPVFWPMVHVKDVASLYAKVLESSEVGIFHATDGEQTSAIDVIETARNVFQKRGVLHSESHDYVKKLLDTSVKTTIHRSLATGWVPSFVGFRNHAAQSFDESRSS